jgi:hypothetical protein
VEECFAGGTLLRSATGGWNGGHEVIYEAGGMHGPADCFRVSVDTGNVSVDTGKQLTIFANYTYDIAGRPD